MSLGRIVVGTLWATSLAWSLSLLGCDGGETETADPDAAYRADVTDGMKATIAADLAGWHEAALALQAAAPEHAWDETADAQALADMRAAWRGGRAHYEHIEGAIAPLFPDLDHATDARYDDFLSELPDGDVDPFDGEGVTGMHGIERILYSDRIPESVVVFESGISGYVAARYPTTDAEALAFKNGLCQRLVDDIATLETQWNDAGTQVDLPLAFQGLVDLMNEQQEKVDLASTGAEESRYSQLTLADLRTNLDGTRTAYALFSPWLKSKEGGEAIDAEISSGFEALDAAYAAIEGDAIPEPPSTWNPQAPSEDDLETPFGRLYVAVSTAVDPARDGSVVVEMGAAADLLGIAAP
jgi:iron uptake system component EfeO